MYFLIIILILFSGINGLDTDESNGIDILQTLKSKNISCNLHDFVIKSGPNSDEEYQILIDDITKYCSNSDVTKPYRLLCHMISITLEIGCLLPNYSRPLSIKYTTQYTSKQICSFSKISLTNNWIWEKLSTNERQQIGSTSLNLCSKVTSFNETLRLARFFYKIAPRIRRSDTVNTTLQVNKTSIIVSSINKILPDKEISIKKSNQTNVGIINKTIENFKNETSENIENNATKILDKNEQQSQLNNNKTDINEQINDSVVAEDQAKLEQKQPMLDGNILEKPDLKKEDDVLELKSINETKKSEEGLPLGRAGEIPQQEQVNERPKPKALDVESAFKANNHQERNWVEGKNVENKVENPVDLNLNNIPRMKFEENPVVVAQPVRKRPLLRLKFNRRYDEDDEVDDISNNFITSFLVFTLCIILIYLILHNKNKVLGLIIEGCRRRRAAKARRTHLAKS